MIAGIHHISMKCGNDADLAKVMEFYHELLELPVVRKWDGGIMIDAGGTWLEVFTTQSGVKDIGAIRHFAFRCDSVDETAGKLAAAGYEVFVQPKDICIASQPPVPARIAFVRGPLQEEIELFEEQ